MRFAIAFGILGVALAVLVVRLARGAAGPWWLLVAGEAYLAACLLALAVAYAARQAGVDVEEILVRPGWSPLVRAILLPYLGLAGLTLSLARRIDREDPMNPFAPGLFIGRLPFPSDWDRLATAGITAVLNLCWEFPRPSGVAGRPDVVVAYVPILDGAAPSASQLREAVERVGGWRAEGKTVLIHCAQGHGRSATVAAAVLCRLGLATEAADALAQVRAARPRARPSRAQRDALERFVTSS
jgi:hypothetical protein